MKKLFTILASVLLMISLCLPGQTNAQAPNKMSYQAVIRNNNGSLLTNTPVGLRISILQGADNGVSIYTETQTPTTNTNGLVNIEIGNDPAFGLIDWANGSYFIKTETDPTGGTNYSIVGTSQLLSVPYALHAKTVIEADPIFTAWDKKTGVSIKESQISDLKTYLTAETDPTFTAWDKKTGISIKESQISDLKTYLTAETDPLFSASVAKGITTADITKWNKSLPTAVAGNMITYDGNNWVAKNLTITTGITGSGTPTNNMQPFAVVQYCIALQGIYPSRDGSEPFLGEIEMFGFNFAPSGWATCNGQLLPITQNTALFSLLGTQYGGDGRVNFALPDLRGRTPIHAGQGPGLSSYYQGQMGGSETTTLTISNLPQHNHPVNIVYQ